MRADDLLFAILRQLNRLQETTQMTATRADLDSAIQLLLAAEATRDAAVSKAIADLAAKVQNGVVSSSSDFAAEVAQLQALQSNAATLDPDSHRRRSRRHQRHGLQQWHVGRRRPDRRYSIGGSRPQHGPWRYCGNWHFIGCARFSRGQHQRGIWGNRFRCSRRHTITQVIWDTVRV